MIRPTHPTSRLTQARGPDVEDEVLGLDRTDREKELSRLQTQLDEIVAGECVLCGNMMVNSIDEPFFDPNDEESASWLIS